MQGDFSSTVLTALLDSGIDVCAVVLAAVPVPGRNPPAIQLREQSRAMRSVLPLVQGSGATFPMQLAQLAWNHHIPVWDVYRFAHRDTVAALSVYQPDILCVACFSRLIPSALLQLPRLGALNVHPSLLPALRGPDPLFWTFREGHATTGVTIHFMSAQMDSGDILAQEVIPVPDGVTYEQLETRCASTGGSLLVTSIWQLYKGSVIRRVQDEANRSYYSLPIAEDFIVPVAAWDARRAYNFVRGMSSWDTPVLFSIEEALVPVRDCSSYSLDTPCPISLSQSAGEVIVPCRVGWVHAVLDAPARVVP
jgi:methionyl-tRNA formyltransferase